MQQPPHAPNAPSTLSMLMIVPWADQVIDHVGHDPRAAYVEQYWLGVVGPTAIWMMRAFARHFDDSPDGFGIDARNLAARLGLGGSTAKNSHLARTIERCEKFGLLRNLDHQVMEVRRRLPPLSAGRVRHLPDSLQASHAAWQRRELERSHSGAGSEAGTGTDPHTDATRRLALAMLDVGQDPDTVRCRFMEWDLSDGDAAVDWARQVLSASASGRSASRRSVS